MRLLINERGIEAGDEVSARPIVLEYRVVYVPKTMAGLPNEGIEADLNKAAGEGWRLAGCLTNEEARTTGLILERDKTAGP